MLEHLTKLWLLADRFAHTKLRNEAMDDMLGVLGVIKAFNNECKATFIAIVITCIWSATTEGRPLQRLVCDCYAYSASSDNMKLNFDDYYPGELLFESLDTIERGDTDTDPTTQVRCYYHEHDKHNPECCQDPPTSRSRYGKVRLKDKEGFASTSSASVPTPLVPSVL